MHVKQPTNTGIGLLNRIEHSHETTLCHTSLNTQLTTAIICNLVSTARITNALTQHFHA